MAIPTITGYTGVIPDRRTQSAEDFTSAAVTWTDYQATTLVPSTNAAIDGINAAQDEILDSVNNAEESSFIAQAAANYQGAWFSGAQVVKGESWSHNGLMWAANVTGAGEPQENAQWFLLNSEPELSAIKVMLEQWGYRYIGLFDDGFTYSQVGDAGVDANNNAWVYTGAGAPDKVVTAGTVPSVGDGYEQVAFNSAGDVTDSRGTNVQDYIDGNLTPFKTVADMKAAVFLSTLPEFTRVEWQGYHAQSDGGSNWGVLRFGTHTEDGGSIFSIDANTYIEANLKGKSVNILKFGAKADDGVTDNRVPIQNTINYAQDNGSSIRIGQTIDGVHYGVNSFNPDVVGRNGNAARKVCLVISEPTNLTIDGFRNRSVNIKYYGTQVGDAVFYVDTPTAKWGLTVNGLGVDASEKLDYCLHASDGAQLANVTFRGGTYANPVLDGIKIAAYMITFERVLFSQLGRYGLHLAGNFDNDSEGETTSLSVKNCWARLAGEAGYRVSNDLWYSHFSSNGCDGLGDTGDKYRPRWGYSLAKSRGVTITGCGAENCDSYLQAEKHFSLVIDTPVGIGLGATSGTVPALIELGGDGSCEISGVPFGFDDFPGVDHTVSINKINERTRLDITGGGIDRDRVNVINSSNGGWTDTVYFAGQSGYSRDLGYPRLNNALYIDKNTELQPRDDVSGRYTLSRRSSIVNNAGVIGPISVPLVNVTAGGGGTVTIKISAVITKIAGSPSPTVSATCVYGVAVYRDNTGYNAKLSVSDIDNSIVADLVWVGTTLKLQHNAQWAYNVIDIDITSLNNGLYVESLI